MIKRGLFISLEGGEGVGKSTNINFLQQMLKQQQIKVVTTREPGGTEFGERLRELLLSQKSAGISSTAELLCIFAARAEHIDKVIEPALAKGCWVITDRFTDATYAYQGGGRNIDFATIATLENLVQAGLKPDVTLLLDAAVEIGMARAAKRSSLDRIESENLGFFKAVRNAYLQRANSEQRFLVVDAAGDLATVQRQIKAYFEPVIDSWRAL